MSYAIIGFEQSVTDGNPYFWFRDAGNFSTMSAAEYAISKQKLNAASDQPVQIYSYNSENDVANYLKSLNSPYVSGTNAQTQDRGYSSPNNPTELWQPTQPQIGEYIEKVYKILPELNTMPFNPSPVVPSLGLTPSNSVNTGGILIIAALAAMAVK